MTRSFSWVVAALGLLAAVGIWFGIAHSDDRLTLAACPGTSFSQFARTSGPGC